MTTLRQPATCFSLALLGICLLLSSNSPREDRLFDRLDASQTGISFRNQLKEDKETNILTYEYFYNGGGVAVGDLNNDGLDDIFFTANMDRNALYLNQGKLKFKDISKKAGVEGRKNAWSTGVTLADVNGDGWLDIYVCYSGWGDENARRNELFINQGNLTFTEQAAAYGLDDPSYSTHAGFFDFDKDGDLDMYLLNHNTTVINEIEYDAVRDTRHPLAGDKLYENTGGHFTDISEKAGIQGSPLGFGLGLALSDINGDGYQDIYVSNDYIEPDYLYINNGNGTFTNKTTDYFQHISYYSMGSDIADVNNDTQPDIYTLDMLPEDNERQKLLYGPDNYEQYALMVMNGFYHQNMRNMLHLNNADGTYSEVGQLAGISNTDWSWSPLFADFDNDGWKDLFVTNGYYRDYTNRDFLKYKGDYYFEKALSGEKADTFELVNTMTSTPLHNYIFRNNQDLTFTDKSDAWGFGDPVFSNGAAYSDLDNDGDLDLVVNNLNERAAVYQNLARETYPDRHYLDLVLKGTNALGSKVYVYTASGAQMYEQTPTRGFQSSVSYKIHVGLGKAAQVDSLRVVWLSGKTQLIKKSKADQTLTLEETNALLPSPAVSVPTACVFSKVPSPVPYRHQEYAYNDFKRQPLLMTMLTTCGPVMAMADIDRDSLPDLFIGGAKGSLGTVFKQDTQGNFAPTEQPFSQADLLGTDGDAAFFDADGDGDQDLYLASGGYQDFQPDDLVLQDRLYLNDGQGNFTLAKGALPKMRVSKSCVKPYDYDQDGDIDLFVGGRVIPGQYPLAPPSFLLENDGSSSGASMPGGQPHFTDVIADKIPTLARAGMVTDAAWTDLDGDGVKDLVVVGEYMPVMVFANKNKAFTEVTNQYFDKPLTGLWNKLLLGDFDQDGDEDLIVGNFGLNTQFKASPQEPLQLYYKDFDGNGSVDPILTHYIQGKSYPFASRSDLLDQMYHLRKKFTSHAAYANASLTDIFSKEDLQDATVLRAETLETVYLENKQTKLVPHPLPKEAQFAPVHAMTTLDYNQDGHPDLILAGNQSAIKIRLGVIDASYGQLFEGDGHGNFSYIPQAKSGLHLRGDVKSLQSIRIEGDIYILAGINNTEVAAYKLTQP